MKFFTKYNPPPSAASPVGKASMTDPQYLNECDINAILRAYKVSGKVPPVVNGGIFADVSQVGDYANVMRIVTEGKAHFEAMPSDIRDRFGNDPSSYFKFVMDPSNRDECIRLGIMRVIKQSETASDVLNKIYGHLVKANPSSADSVPPSTT